MKARMKPLTVNTIAAIGSAMIMLYFLLSFSESTGTKQPQTDQTTKTRPDYYLNNVESSYFNQQGSMEFNITSQSIIQNPANNSSNLSKPILEAFDNGTRTWTVTSDTGIANSKGNKIELIDNVIIGSEDQRSRLETSQLTVFTDKEIAKTQKAVRLVSPDGLTHAQGTLIDMQSKEIIMLGKIKGYYNVSP